MTLHAIETLIRTLIDPKRDKYSGPLKGTLKCLVLNYSIEDGWQAIATFWFVDGWFFGKGADPARCIVDALTKVNVAPNPTVNPTPIPRSDFDDLLG